MPPSEASAPGIDREEQALIAQVLVELLAGDAGLDDAVEILGVHREHPVHVAEVDRHAAERRVDVALQRRAGAERDDRHAVRRADAHDLLHVLGDCGKTTASGGSLATQVSGVAMLLAHRLRGDEAIAELAASAAMVSAMALASRCIGLSFASTNAVPVR